MPIKMRNYTVLDVGYEVLTLSGNKVVSPFKMRGTRTIRKGQVWSGGAVDWSSCFQKRMGVFVSYLYTVSKESPPSVN